MNEELISAYLDGELTAEEQTQVEQALAADKRLRQMHDDLRTLRASLQSMPRQSLGADFADRVLAACAAAQPAPHHEPEVLVAVHHGKETVVTPAQHEPLAWRAMVWGIAGIAATLMLMLFWPEQTSKLADRGEETLPKFAQDAERTKRSEQADPAATNPTQRGQVPLDAKAMNTAEAPRVESATTKDEQAKSLNIEQKADAAKAEFGAGGGRGSGGGKLDGVPSERESMAPGAPRPGFAEEKTQRDIAGKPRNNFDDAGPEQTGNRAIRSSAMAMRVAEPELRVIVVKMPAAEIARRPVDASLARLGIAVREDGKAKKESQDPSAEGLQPTPKPVADAVEAPAGPGIANANAGEGGTAELDTAAGRKLPADVERLAALHAAAEDAVYVEATHEQVQQALNDLRVQSDRKLAEVELDAIDQREKQSATRRRAQAPFDLDPIAAKSTPPLAPNVAEASEGIGAARAVPSAQAIRADVGDSSAQAMRDRNGGAVRPFAARVQLDKEAVREGLSPKAAGQPDALTEAKPAERRKPAAITAAPGDAVKTADLAHQGEEALDKGSQPEKRVRVLILIEPAE